MFVFLKVFRQTLKLVFLMFYYVYMFCMLIIAFYINDPNIHITQVRRVASKSSFWRLLTTKQLLCYQDWEFDSRFFDPIARFLWSKDRFDREKDWIASNDPFKRSAGSFCSWSLFIYRINSLMVDPIDKSESIPLIFKKDQRSTGAIWICSFGKKTKKGGKL